MARKNEKVVRALLAQAESAGINSPEGKTFHAKAFALMARWGIDEAIAYQKDPTTDVLITKKVRFGAPFATTKRDLYAALVMAHRGRIIYTDLTSKTCHLFIYQSDYDTVEFLYTILLQNGISELNRTEIKGNAKSFSVSFWKGYIYEISVRLSNAVKTEAKTTTGAEVALYSKEMAAENAKRKIYEKTGKHHSATATNYSGWSAGKNAGSRADFGTKNVGGNRREIE